MFRINHRYSFTGILLILAALAVSGQIRNESMSLLMQSGMGDKVFSINSDLTPHARTFLLSGNRTHTDSLFTNSTGFATNATFTEGIGGAVQTIPLFPNVIPSYHRSSSGVNKPLLITSTLYCAYLGLSIYTRETYYKGRSASNPMNEPNSVVSSSFIGGLCGYVTGSIIALRVDQLFINDPASWINLVNVITTIYGVGCGAVVGAIIAFAHPDNTAYYYMGPVGFSIVLPMITLSL